MKPLFLIALFIMFQPALYAQDTVKLKTPNIKSRIYEATVRGDKAVLYDHYLVGVQDSSIMVSKTPVPFNMTSGKTGFQIINLSEIDEITLKRKGSAGRGALTGALIGAGAGILIGFASGDDNTGWFRFSAGEKAAALGLSLGALGGLVGVITGALSRDKFYIGRDRQRLQYMKLSLLEKVYMKP
jgi:hypothetical protein